MIEYFESPIPHIIVRNVFSDSDLKKIWQELDFLTYPSKLSPPDNRSAKDNGKILKKNHTVFLEEVYTKPEFSNIVTATRNVFTKEFFEEIASKNSIFEWVKIVNHESFLLSYYENNDTYLPHKDNAVYTVLINFYKEPKAFVGGDLTLGNAGYKIPLENNRLILIPSWASHGVTPVKFNQEYEQFTGHGRYTITDFFFINNIVI